MFRQRFHLVVMMLMLALHGIMAFWVDRDQSIVVLASYTGLNLFWFLSWFDLKITVKQILLLGLLFRGIYLFHIPELSDDFYRYIWDGKLVLNGISPFAHTPVEWMQLNPLFDNSGLYPMLNSKQYFSVYPPVQQTIYTLVNLIAGDKLILQVLTLRLFTILVELGSMVLIIRLLNHYKRPAKELMLYALNPLIIIEFVGNLHGEVFMVFFLLLFLLYWVRGRLVFSSLTFALAVLTKLLPLMFLPAILLRTNWKNATIFTVIVVLISTIGFPPFGSVDDLMNINRSLEKYFLSFEFNASIYYLIREFGFWWKGYNIIHLAGKVIPLVVLGLILSISFFQRKREVLPTTMMFAWMVYYLFSTTVNPWYVAVLVPLSLFANYRAAFLWTVLVPLSYHAFGLDGVDESFALLLFEYLPVYGWLAYELGFIDPILRWWSSRKASIKWKRIGSFYSDGETVVDVGCGNGALSLQMREAGVNVLPVDVVDKSIFKELPPQIYDGERLDLVVNENVDAVQMITMLHHVEAPEKLLKQATTVSNKVVVMEDVYSNPLQELITHITDSIVNLEFIGHPHTNKTDEEWREIFSDFDLNLQKFKTERFLIFFRQNTYFLTKDTG